MDYLRTWPLRAKRSQYHILNSSQRHSKVRKRMLPIGPTWPSEAGPWNLPEPQFHVPAASGKAHSIPKDTYLIRYTLPVDQLCPMPSPQHPPEKRTFLLDNFCVFGRPLSTTLGLHLLCSLKSSIPVNPSRRIKGGEKNP